MIKNIMNRFKRSDRVSALISREISKIIDYQMRDTRIGMVTVTGVDLSNDLRNAKVYVSVLGSETEINTSVSALNSASNFIRARLGERIILRYLPTITFFYDPSTIEGMRMDKILDDIKKDQ